MEGFKKILVPVDFSESSFNALETAVCLAGKNNAALEIIYARDNIPEKLMQEQPRKREVENSKAIMHAYVTAIEQKHQLKPSLIWEEGLPAEAIIRTATSNHPDLIVTGTHGASGYRESFIGSTAYTVIKYATCPVLTIPARNKWLSFEKLLLPVRPLHGALKKHEVFLKIAANAAKMDVLDLSSGRSEDDEQLISFMVGELKDKINGSGLTVNITRGLGNNVPEIILNTVTRKKYDIVLLTPSIDMTNKQFFIGPYTQRIINQSPIPVLVIKRSF